MKKLLALLLALIMVLSFASCGKEQTDLEKIQDEGKIIVGITEYAPMDYKEGDKWVGFDAEFAEAVAKKLDVEVEFKVIDWDNKFLELSSGAIDCIWNGMTITDEVKKNTSCSKPYAKNEQVVVLNKEIAADYAEVDSVKELKFAVESGSAAESVAKDAGYEYVAVKAQSDALLEVESGSVDACIIDITMAASMTGEGTSYADLVQGVSLTKEEYGIGFRKGSDLTEKINGYIDEMKADGTLTALSEKYGVAIAD